MVVIWYHKIDLHSAYRSVPINLENFYCTGLQFKFTGDDAPTYLIDRRFPFGCNKGPMIFHRISQSVKQMMSCKGFDGVVVYLDDFLCAACFVITACQVRFSNLMAKGDKCHKCWILGYHNWYHSLLCFSQRGKSGKTVLKVKKFPELENAPQSVSCNVLWGP